MKCWIDFTSVAYACWHYRTSRLRLQPSSKQPNKHISPNVRPWNHGWSLEIMILILCIPKTWATVNPSIISYLYIGKSRKKFKYHFGKFEFKDLPASIGHAKLGQWQHDYFATRSFLRKKIKYISIRFLINDLQLTEIWKSKSNKD